MPIELRRAYLEEIRYRYKNSQKKQKSAILDEFCQVCGYNRKHAVRILSGKLSTRTQRPGPRSRYQREDFLKALKELWELMNRMCSKKMVVAFNDWLPYYQASDEVLELLTKISASSIDRLLRSHRNPLMRGKSTTSASLIKNRIPLKLLDGEVKIPGYTESDTVAHCGNSIAGEYINSLTVTDLLSGWTVNRAVWTKQADQMIKALGKVEEQLPFAWISSASDNGSEFLNESVIEFFCNRQAPIHMIRRRAYKKNDNAHVEQKNWTHVRQLFGYERLDDVSLLPLMNEIYQAYWGPLQNYFTPVLKLVSKERVGGRVVKKYDKPKTPFKRLMECSYVPESQKAKLRDNYSTKNPIYLKRELDKKLKEFFQLVDERRRRNRETGS